MGSLALLIVLLVGCSSGDGGVDAAPEDASESVEDDDVATGDDDPVDEVPAETPEGTDDGPGDTDDGPGDTDDEPGAGDVASGEAASLDGPALASVTNANGTVLSITRLDRVGELVVLGYEIDNTAGETDLATIFVWGRRSAFEASDLDQPYLLDEANLVRYRVLRDSDDECLCQRVSGVDAGEARSFNSTHPAPPTDIDRVSVVFPDFPPFPGVPISVS